MKKRYAAIIETDVGLLIVQEKKDKEVPHILNSLRVSLQNLEFDDAVFHEFTRIFQDLQINLVHMIEAFLQASNLSPNHVRQRKSMIFHEVHNFTKVLSELPESQKSNLELAALIKNINTLGIVLDGRFALPGGGMEEADQESPENTIVREIQEELSLRVEKIQHAFTLPRANRTHEMYFVKAGGKLKPNLDEISGLGFLNEENAFPIQSTFFQSHIAWLYRKYIINSNQEQPLRPEIRNQFTAHLKLMDVDIRKWFIQQHHVSQIRDKTKEFEVVIPAPTDRLLIEYNRQAEQAGKPTYNSDYQLNQSSFSQPYPSPQSSLMPMLSPTELFDTSSDSGGKFPDSSERCIIDEVSSTSLGVISAIENTVPSLYESKDKSTDHDLPPNQSTSAEPDNKKIDSKKSGSYRRPNLTSTHSVRQRGTSPKSVIKTNQLHLPKTPKKVSG